MIFRRFLFYLIFFTAVLIRRIFDDSLRVDALLIAEISASALLLLFSLVRWLCFRYGCDGEFFVIKKGVFIKREIMVRLSKISSVDADAEIILKFLRGTLLRVDTEAGCYKKSDFEFPVYNRDFETISGLLASGGRRVYTSGAGECVFGAATLASAHIGILIAAPVLMRVGNILGVRTRDALREGVGAVERFSLHVLPTALSVVAIILLAGWLVNFLHILMQYLNLRLDSDDSFVTVRRGAVIKHRTLLSKNSVRAYIIRKPPLMLMFRRSRVHALCAGYGKERGEVSLLSASDGDFAQKKLMEKLFGGRYSFSTALSPRKNAPMTQRTLYFSLFAVLTALMLAVNLIFPDSVSAPYIYFTASFFVFVKWAVATGCISRTGISADLRYICVLKGFSLCRVYFPVTLPREIKITRNPFQRITGSCNLKVYLRSEKRRCYTLRCLDFKEAEGFISNL